jgi:hypothetical protein
MSAQNRFEGKEFTCSNSRFHTDITKGKRHGARKSRGSVFPEPLENSNGYTLWLEHVIDKRNATETFWLMWYDPNGSPTIAESSVIPADRIKEMVSRLAGFIDL